MFECIITFWWPLVGGPVPSRHPAENCGPAGVARRFNFPGGHVEPGEESISAGGRSPTYCPGGWPTPACTARTFWRCWPWHWMSSGHLALRNFPPEFALRQITLARAFYCRRKAIAIRDIHPLLELQHEFFYRSPRLGGPQRPACQPRVYVPGLAGAVSAPPPVVEPPHVYAEFAQKRASLSLSEGNRTLTLTSFDGNWASAFANLAKADGKYYVEITPPADSVYIGLLPEGFNSMIGVPGATGPGTGIGLNNGGYVASGAITCTAMRWRDGGVRRVHWPSISAAGRSRFTRNARCSAPGPSMPRPACRRARSKSGSPSTPP